jgi:hypothetical protein
MNHLKLIRQFLDGRRSFDELHETGYPFVTISRQSGAGAQRLADYLLSEFTHQSNAELFGGWHIFDRNLCEVVAEDPEIQEAFKTAIDEHAYSEFKDFMESLFTGRAPRYVLYKKTFKIMRLLALLGKVILIGRAGALVTRDLKQGVHVRLVAPEAQRIVRMMTRYKLTREEARQVVARQDADRRKLIRMFFHREIEDPLLYDVVWNTGTVSLPEISQAVVALIKSRMARVSRTTTEG